MINFKLIEFKNVYISWCVRSLIFVVILFFIATAIDTYHNGRLVYKGSYIFKSIDPEWFFIRLLANYIWLLGPLVFLLGIRTKKSRQQIGHTKRLVISNRQFRTPTF
jgi:hypothetical protein